MKSLRHRDVGEARPEARLAWAWVPRAERAPPPVRAFVRPFATGAAGLRPDPHGETFALSPVTAFTPLPPRQRPPAFCPVCLERVTLKLGRVLRGHFAHRPHAGCPAARGEGALHLDAKLHLASALAAVPGAALRFRRRCAGVPGERAGGCPGSPVEAWRVAAWDAVGIEHALGEARPDVVLLNGGRPVAALEVLSTHGVSPVKGEVYRALGLPWLEVPARALIPDAGIPWSPGEPLEAAADAALHPGRWRCALCAPRHAALEAMAEDGVRELARRPVHLYLRDAGRTGGEVRVRRLDVRVVEQRRAGRTVEVWLERSGTGARIAGPVRATDEAEAMMAAHALFRAWSARQRRERGASVESPTHWLSGLAGPCPQRLRWDAHAERFRGPPNLPTLAWPAPATMGAGWLDPHPVLGFARCAWSERHPRMGVLTHAVAGSAWLTLSEHAWEEEGSPRARADVSVWLHSGGRWSPTAEASWSGPPRDWSGALQDIAEAVAAAIPTDSAALTRLLAEAAMRPSRYAPPSPR